MFSIVLSRRDFKEYDQIVALYTKEEGKIKAIAKGVKKITSKNSANLETLSLCEVEIVRGKETDRIARVQPVKIFKEIFFDFNKIWLARYAVKLADENILFAEPDERIFILLAGFLDFINSAKKINSVNLATGFIFKLWHYLGFGAQDKNALVWLEKDWQTINDLNLPENEQAKAHNLAVKFAQYHSGRQVWTFSPLYANMAMRKG